MPLPEASQFSRISSTFEYSFKRDRGINCRRDAPVDQGLNADALLAGGSAGVLLNSSTEQRDFRILVSAYPTLPPGDRRNLHREEGSSKSGAPAASARRCMLHLVQDVELGAIKMEPRNPENVPSLGEGWAPNPALENYAPAGLPSKTS